MNKIELFPRFFSRKHCPIVQIYSKCDTKCIKADNYTTIKNNSTYIDTIKPI